MKKKICFSLFLGLLTLNLLAQKDERVIGVFKTGDDFNEGKVSFLIDCKSKKNRIKLNDFFCKPYITIKQNDSSYKILKSTLYGYKTCNNQIYRFDNKKELLVLNQGEQILIYKQLNTKVREDARINVTNKYFSTESNNSIQKLTIKNLKASFPNNTNFQHLIDGSFQYNTDLGGFDNINKMYKINWFLKLSMK